MRTGYYRASREYSVFLQHSDEKKVAAGAIHDCVQARGLDPARIWDVGCGSGELIANVLDLLNSSGRERLREVVLLDPDTGLLRAAERQVKTVTQAEVVCVSKKVENVEANQDYYPGFDLIIGSHLLYYVEDVEGVVDRLYRALSPAGVMCLIARTSSADPFRVRKLFKECSGDDTGSMLSGEKMFEVVQEMGLDARLQIVVSHIEVPKDDVICFLRNGHRRRLRRNVMAWITKLMGHSSSLIVPEDLLDRIGRILHTRIEGDSARLLLEDAFVWITRD